MLSKIKTQQINPIKNNLKGRKKNAQQLIKSFQIDDEPKQQMKPQSDDDSQQQLNRLKKQKKITKLNQIQKQILIYQKQQFAEPQASQSDIDQQDSQKKKYFEVDDQGFKRIQEEQLKGKKSKSKKAKPGEQKINKFLAKNVDNFEQTPQKNSKTKSTPINNLKSLFSISEAPKKVQPSTMPKPIQQKTESKKNSDSDSDSEDSIEANRRRFQMMSKYNSMENNTGFLFKEKESTNESNFQKVQQVPVKHQQQNIFKGAKTLSNQTAATQQKNIQDESEQFSLKNKGVILVGQFDPYTKSSILQILLQQGAEDQKSINGKTAFVLLGSYLKNKFGKKTDQKLRTAPQALEAVQKNITVIQFQGINNFFMEKIGKSLDEILNKKDTHEQVKYVEIQQISTLMIDEKNEKQISNLTKPINKQSQTLPQPINQKKDTTTTVRPSISIPTTFSPTIQWTEKHKPRSLPQIAGQEANIKSLNQWLNIWHDVHIKGNKRSVKPSFSSFAPSGTINSNAALLSGSAGLGKTTTARLIAQQHGFQVVQYNASDARNKKSVQLIALGNNNMAIGSKNKSLACKTLIIMDQVDGMSSGDRGGIISIIDLIKKTKIPIICICNDRQSSKIRSLAAHCYDIKFQKPEKFKIVKRLESILKIEGAQYDVKALDTLVDNLQGDIRQIISYLEIIFKANNKAITMKTIEKQVGQTKDTSLIMNHNEATRKLTNRMIFNKLSLEQRIDLSFIDSDLVPLTVHQNYLSAFYKKKITKSDFKAVVAATESISIADKIDKLIVKTQSYCLMVNKMFLSCVYPCEKVCQNLGYPKFPQWLGKFSSQRKNRRLIKQLKNTISQVLPSTTQSIKFNIAPMLLETICHNLKKTDENIVQVVKFMIHYRITPAILNEHITGLQYGDRSQLFKNVQTSKKTRLTKMYNKMVDSNKNVKKQSKKSKETEIESRKYNDIMGDMENEGGSGNEEQMEDQT